MKYSAFMPVITITGPRQSGKTTLVRHLFPDYDYYNFELPLTRNKFIENPLQFLNNSGKGMIIDEFQHVNDFLSYIQVVSDENEIPGRFILTGSQNYIMLSKISQSLAGRTALFSLLPFSLNELANTNFKQNDYMSGMLRGFYPRTVLDMVPAEKWFEDYINLYLERDVKNILNVKDIAAFSNFLKFCAARCGQILNLTELSKNVGRDIKTIKSWLSVLEISNIIFFLKPYYRNFNKRISKSPKLYFYDTGLCCALLNLNDSNSLRNHQLFGSLFENFVVAEIMKLINNGERKLETYFWNERGTKEIDLIIDNGNSMRLIEIKSSDSPNLKTGKYLLDFSKFSEIDIEKNIIVYTGENLQNHGIEFINWQNINSVFE